MHRKILVSYLMTFMFLSGCQVMTDSPTVKPVAHLSAEPKPILPKNAQPPDQMEPTPEPSIAPSIINSPQISPEPFVSCPPDRQSFVEKAILLGYVYDDKNQPLQGARIKISSIHPCYSFDIEILTNAQGEFSYPQGPSGVVLELMATKPGYSSRRSTAVLKCCRDGLLYSNRTDFGTDGISTNFGVFYNALSDKPEVVRAMPGRNATGVAANAPIRLGFSEPMTIASVEENFQVQPVEKVSGDKQVWSQEDFVISWNPDKTEVTFAFKSGHELSTSLADNPMPPKYRVSLNRLNGILADATGVERKSAPFKLTDGNFESDYTFSLMLSQKE